MADALKLSVHMVTYNQVAFVGQALDSILGQRLPCDYEIVIGDDCSSDGTAQIIQDYHRRWPNRIKPVLRQKNLGPGPNAVDILQRCNGQYIAFLEGDDYWTDADKLRLQLQYLEQNADCALVHHRVRHVGWPGGKCLAEQPRGQFRTERPTARALAMSNFIQTCSVMFRRKCLPPLDEEFHQLRIGDWPLFVLLSQHGWIGYIDRTMADYRIHGTNNWNGRAAEYKLKAMENMARYLVERVNDDSKGFWHNTILALAFKNAFLALRAGNLPGFVTRLAHFIRMSQELKKPFWLLDSLWPYFRANYSGA